MSAADHCVSCITPLKGRASYIVPTRELRDPPPELVGQPHVWFCRPCYLRAIHMPESERVIPGAMGATERDPK